MNKAELGTSAQRRTVSGSDAFRLRRVLKLRDLIFYGIVLVSPIGPVVLFGLTQQLSGGHAVTSVLIAGVAMIVTAVSYGRMATRFPSAGSAYTYVGQGLHPQLGFLAGWGMSLDYLVLPTVAVTQASLAMARLTDKVPYLVWVAIFVGVMTMLNLRGVRSTARADLTLSVCMFIVIGLFLLAAVRYLLHVRVWSALFSLYPFYDSRSFSLSSIVTGTSFAALTYIGFDGVTTLAEDVENPRRNVLLAMVIVCVFIDFFSCLQVYLAQLIRPDYHTFPNIETAFMDVSRQVGGPALFQVIGIIVILASFGGGLAAQVGAARLLFGMGRDNMLPRKLFGHLDPKRCNPSYNICLVGVLTIAGSLLLSFERAAEILNFGAFFSFMGVNLATLKQFYFMQPDARKRQLFRDGVVPAFGFLFCMGIWLNLPRPAKVVGTVWLLGGIAYYVLRIRSSRAYSVTLDFGDE